MSTVTTARIHTARTYAAALAALAVAAAAGFWMSLTSRDMPGGEALTLEDDAVVSEQDGSGTKVKPFVRDELLGPLERWFFGRS